MVPDSYRMMSTRRRGTEYIFSLCVDYIQIPFAFLLLSFDSRIFGIILAWTCRSLRRMHLLLHFGCNAAVKKWAVMSRKATWLLIYPPSCSHRFLPSELLIADFSLFFVLFPQTLHFLRRRKKSLICRIEFHNSSLSFQKKQPVGETSRTEFLLRGKNDFCSLFRFCLSFFFPFSPFDTFSRFWVPSFLLEFPLRSSSWDRAKKTRSAIKK